MKKVYIINKGGHDYNDAERYGQLVFLSEGTVDKNGISNMYRMMSAAIELSEPDDFILLCGLPTMQSIACAMFAHKHGRLNLLLFVNDRYQARTLNMSNLLTSDLIEEQSIEKEKQS